jgi:hypothetical protein
MKDLTLEELVEKLRVAKLKFANCGCKIYKEEAISLKIRIKEITNG